MWFKIKCGVMTCIIIIAVFMARDLSRPLWENGYDMSYESNITEESVTVGAFGGENTSVEPEVRTERISTFKHIVDLVSQGAVPLIMYLLSVLCLVDLIKSTYSKYNKERDIIDKTLYIMLIIGQMGLIGLISYYVVTISFEVLVVWLLFTLIVTTVIYLGPSLVQYRRKYK
ncbi:MAG: hypothetical protein RR844_00655 [Clostridium sp.]